MSRRPARFLSRRIGGKPWQRSAAVGALVADAAGVVGLLVLVLYRPLYALMVLALALLFVATFFVALTSGGPRRVLGIAGAVSSGAALVASVVLWSPRGGEPGWLPAGVLVAFLTGAVLQRYALVIPPPRRARLPGLMQGASARRRPVLIVNLRSGGGKAERVDLMGACLDAGVEAVVLDPGVDLVELARDLADGGADVIGMAGGDGSLGYVASVCVERDLPFVCVPVGTRNHFALDAGLDRNDPCQALAAFHSGEERRIDHGLVNDRLFLNNVSLGVYAAIVEQDGYREAKFETALSMLPELWAAGGPWFDLCFEVPGHGRLDRAALLQVSNNPYAPGELGRRARLDTGELGVVTADPHRIAELVGLTLLAFAGHPERASALWSWSTDLLRVESGQSRIAAGLDGETVLLETPIEFTVRPGVLRLLVPVGSRVGLEEQNLGAGGAYGALVAVALGLDDRGDAEGHADRR